MSQHDHQHTPVAAPDPHAEHAPQHEQHDHASMSHGGTTTRR